MQVNLNGFVSRYLEREIKKLYLSNIYILEDLLSNGNIIESEFNRLRKRTLDAGNGCLRDIDLQISEFDFALKTRK